MTHINMIEKQAAVRFQLNNFFILIHFMLVVFIPLRFACTADRALKRGTSQTSCISTPQIQIGRLMNYYSLPPLYQVLKRNATRKREGN